jgi:hypothetical protein
MDVNTFHVEIANKLARNANIRRHLESIVWYGSSSKGFDMHPRSDCDLHIILDKPDYLTTLNLSKILDNYPNVDLSIIYLKDILSHNNKLIFQNGTKGLFFLYVLSVGKILYGRNVYKDIVDGLGIDDIKPSLSFTIKEYLSRLRIMATRNPNDSLKFKKYSLKLLQDLLVFDGHILPEAFDGLSYAKTIKESKKYLSFSDKSINNLDELNIFDKTFSSKQMAILLTEYESIVDEVIVNEQ